MKEIEITRAGMEEKCPRPKWRGLMGKGYVMCHRCEYCKEIVSETKVLCDYK